MTINKKSIGMDNVTDNPTLTIHFCGKLYLNNIYRKIIIREWISVGLSGQEKTQKETE